MFVCLTIASLREEKSQHVRSEIYVSVIRKRSKFLLMKNATRCHVESAQSETSFFSIFLNLLHTAALGNRQTANRVCLGSVFYVALTQGLRLLTGVMSLIV